MKPDAYEVVKEEQGYTMLLTPVDMSGKTLTGDESIQKLYSKEKIVQKLKELENEANEEAETDLGKLMTFKIKCLEEFWTEDGSE